MAKITIGVGKETKWTKYATIEVSMREAALLGIIMSKCNGRHSVVMDIYEKFIGLVREYGIETVDLNKHGALYEYLDTLGEE